MFLQYLLIMIVSCVLHVTAPETSHDQKLNEDQSTSGWTEPCITDDTSRHCYEIFDTEITWKKASDLCKHDGGSLVTIESVEEQKFIEDLMKKRTFNVSGLWIGSDKLHPEEQRAWANGEKFSYVNWAPGEPDSMINENCVEMRTDDGKWNDVKCTKRNMFICEGPGRDPFIGEYRYSIATILMTWDEALNFCYREGRKLLIIETAEEQTFIADKTLFEEFNVEWLWLGSNKVHPESKRTWTNGTKFTYVNWAEGEPNNLVENCAEMYTYNSTWNDRECTLLRGYICETTRLTKTCIKDETSGHCYQISDTKITWKKASDLCKHDGGNLVTIETVEEQKFIADLMKKITFDASGLWIGSDKLHPEEQRAWANGEKFSYVNWAPGEPDHPQIDENCVEISSNDGTWNDVKCTEQNGYICENSRAVRNYIQDNSTKRWYKLVDELITWDEALNICYREGGTLMIIETAEDQTFIAGIIQSEKLNVEGLWLGSNKVHPESKRTWTNGKKFTYVNWAEGEPNNSPYVENCAEMYTDNSMWNDRECTLLRGFICEKTPEVTPYKVQGIFIIITTVGSALVIVVGVTILCCLLHKRNKYKKKNEDYQDVQNVEMSQAEHEYNRHTALSDNYHTIHDN